MTDAVCGCQAQEITQLEFTSLLVEARSFPVNANVNQRNKHWLTDDPEDAPVIARLTFPANVHIPSIVSYEGDILPSHLLKKRETIIVKIYLPILRFVAKP